MPPQHWSVVEVDNGNADTIHAELVTIYDGAAEADVIVCPVTEGTPTRQDFQHFIDDSKLSLRACYHNDVLEVVYLMAGTAVRAGWGTSDKSTLVDSGVDALMPFLGGKLVIDTGTKGWVIREWLDRYSLNVGPFDMTRTDHPRGKKRSQTTGNIADLDDSRWALRIWEDQSEPGGIAWYFDVVPE